MAARRTDKNALRGCFGTVPVGGAVVSTVDGSGELVGMTASWFNAISMEPPIISISFLRESRCRGAFMGCEEFAVVGNARNRGRWDARKRGHRFVGF